LAEIKKDDKKTQNIKINRLQVLNKHSTEKKENLDQLIGELEQKVAVIV
jgi:hypothetical protein